RTPIEKLRAHSCRLFPALSAELRERTGIDNGYVCCGGLEFLAPLGESAAEEWHAEGLALPALDEPAVRRLGPPLAPGLGHAVHLPDMAQLRNPRHLKALLAACTIRGVGLRPDCAATGLLRSGQRVQAVETSAGSITADRVLIAAGAWSTPLLQPLGWRP